MKLLPFWAASSPCFSFRFLLHCLDSMNEHLGRIISNTFVDKYAWKHAKPTGTCWFRMFSRIFVNHSPRHMNNGKFCAWNLLSRVPPHSRRPCTTFTPHKPPFTSYASLWTVVFLFRRMRAGAKLSYWRNHWRNDSVRRHQRNTRMRINSQTRDASEMHDRELVSLARFKMSSLRRKHPLPVSTKQPYRISPHFFTDTASTVDRKLAQGQCNWRMVSLDCSPLSAVCLCIVKSSS